MIAKYFGDQPRDERTDEDEEKGSDKPDTTKEYEGKLVSYKFTEDKGKVETESGEQYVFDIKDITDATLKKQEKTAPPRIIIRFLLSSC